MDRKCRECGGAPDVAIAYGDHDYGNLAICYSCIPKVIKSQIENRNREIQAERDSSDPWWRNTDKDKPSRLCWNAIWYICYPMENY